jgi:hypothetical protein
MSDETRKKISASLLGRRCSPATEFKKGFVPWNYKGEPYHLRNGYIGTFKNGRTRFLHSVIAEGVLGRPLKKGEMVHHINMDKADCSRGNLLICDQKYHRWLHHAMELAWVREHLAAGA